MPAAQRCLILVLALSRATLLSAQEVDCTDSVTTLAMRQCLSMQLRKAEQELHVLLDSLSARLDDSTRTVLDSASDRWFEYRRAECGAVFGSYGGGSMGLVENLNCYILLTRRRLGDLRVFYSDELTSDEDQ